VGVAERQTLPENTDVIERLISGQQLFHCNVVLCNKHKINEVVSAELQILPARYGVLT